MKGTQSLKCMEPGASLLKNYPSYQNCKISGRELYSHGYLIKMEVLTSQEYAA